MTRFVPNRLSIASTRKLGKPARTNGISVHSLDTKFSERTLELSQSVMILSKTVNDLLQKSHQDQAALDAATQRSLVAANRLGSALGAINDGIAIFDVDGRLVQANHIWMKAFDGVHDVAPGATYETILRVAVDEGLIDLQDEAAENWVTGMLARWEDDNITPKDIRLFNGVRVRVTDTRTPQGDIVSLCNLLPNNSPGQIDHKRAHDRMKVKMDTQVFYHANDDFDALVSISSTMTHRSACGDAHPPKISGLTPTQEPAAHEPNAWVTSGNATQNPKREAVLWCYTSNTDRDHRVAASTDSHRYRSPSRKANMANLTAAIQKKNAKLKGALAGSHDVLWRLSSSKWLKAIRHISQPQGDTMDRGKTVDPAPLLLLPTQRV